MSKPCDISCESKNIEMPLTTLLSLIPDFDTKDNNEVYRYIRSCDAAFNLANINQRHVILTYALNKITGPCSADVHAKQFTNWIELKTFLIQKFSQTKTLAHLNLELQSMYQTPNETITDYYHRVELCRSKIIEKLNTEICDNTLIGRLVTTEETALNVFINGLNSDIGIMLRTKEFNNFSEAGRFALHEDKIRAMNNARQALFRLPTPRPLIMTNRPPIRTGLENPRREITYSQYRQIAPTQHDKHPYSMHKDSKICSYCKNFGHVIADCRKRIYNNNNNLKNQRALPAPPAKVGNLNYWATNEAGDSLEIATCPDTLTLAENLDEPRI